MTEIYIVRATDSEGTYEYEYGNLEHAKEHYDTETTASLILWIDNTEAVLYKKGE